MINPFKYNTFYHYNLAFDCLKRIFTKNKKIKVLDYGCGNGEFIGDIVNKTKHLYGCDVDPDKIKLAKLQYPHVSFKLGKVDGQLPHRDSSFNVITMFHVLEHVGSEKKAISEVCRILKKDGLLLLASPYNGLFTWADAANLRFCFPKFHKWFFITFLGKFEYEKRFTDRQSIGMYGDCTNNRNWHKHYIQEELEDLLSKGFTIQKIYKFSFFYPFLLIPYNFINYLFKSKNNLFSSVIHVDNLIDAGNWSYNFFLIAKKK